MLNLIRMNLYRMVKTKSLWVVMFCMGMFCVYSCSMSKMDLTERKKEVHMVNDMNGNGASEPLIGIYQGEEDEEVDAVFGITVNVPEKENGEVPAFLEFYNADLASGIVLIFLTIGCALYFNGGIKSGFLKNIAGQTRHKSSIFLSKTFVNMIYVLLALFVYGIVQYISLKFLLADQFTFRFGKEYLKETGWLGVSIYLLYMAFSGGISLITVVFKSTSVSITMGMLSAFGLINSFVPYIEKSLDVKLLKYMVTTNIHQMLIGTAGKDVMFAIGAGILYSVFYYLLGTVYFTKKDVV